MIDTHQRRGLRQTIPLDHGIAKTAPKLLGFRIERRAARNEGPEFPSQPTMHIAKNPPPAEKSLPLGSPELRPKCFDTPSALDVALYLVLQRLQHARHRYQHRNSLPPDSLDNLRRAQRFLEDHRPRHQGRKKYTQELPEHVTQRQQIQETHRMHPTLVLEILADFRFERRYVA